MPKSGDDLNNKIRRKLHGVFNKIDHIFNAACIITDLHCRLKMVIIMIIQLIELGSQIIEFIKDDFGNPYEEWFISDYDCYVDGLYEKLGEYENLDELCNQQDNPELPSYRVLRYSNVPDQHCFLLPDRFHTLLQNITMETVRTFRMNTGLWILWFLVRKRGKL